MDESGKQFCKIHELCKDSTAVHDIAPLYYPNEAHRLVDTTELFFIDSDRYKEITFLNSKYSLFQMPKQIHEIKRLTGFTMIKQLPNEKDICLLLPKEVRPQGISLVCTEEIANNNSEYSRDCPLSIHFQNLKLIAPSIQQLSMCKVLAGTVENVTEFCTSFIDLIIKMDICVRPHLMCNVKVDSCLIDTIKVSYILQQTQENYILYVDSEDTAGYFFKKNLAHSLCVEIARCHRMELTNYLEAVVHVSEFLGIQCQDDLSEIFEKYNIKYQHIEILLQSDKTLVLGKIIPEGFRALLYKGDINHIFTPEEWVGYEISEGVIVVAIVLCPLLSQDNYALTLKYKILIDDSEAGEITVTALDLYKFKAPKFITESDSQELVPSNFSSTSGELKTLTDSHTLTLIELKKKICSELKLIWRLQDEKEKTKGIKRLYLKYHPDKADPSLTHIYEEAFKFLKRQIDRLENNLPLEDPNNTLNEHEPVPTMSGWTSYYPRWESYVPRSSSRQKSNTTNHHDENRSENPWKTFFTQYQPTSDTETSKQWLKQAESDMTAMNLLKESPPSYKVHCQVLFFSS